MNTRIASIVSSLAVAVLALAMAGHFCFSQGGGRHCVPTLGPVDGPPSCAPTPEDYPDAECVA
jgi:hypothetical protein